MTRPRRDVPGGQADALAHLDGVLDPVSLAAALGKLPPSHALVAAARAGAEVSDLRWERREQLRQAGKDVASGWRHNDWAVPHEELVRRRAEVPAQRRPPDADPDLAAAFAACATAVAACHARGSGDDQDDDAEGDPSRVQIEDEADVAAAL